MREERFPIACKFGVEILDDLPRVFHVDGITALVTIGYNGNCV
jgi:hypothetical protein